MPLSTQDLQDIILNDAARLGNDPALMLALADHESGGFNPNALSPTGVRGLFQVTNATGKPYGQTPQTRSDPRVSSDAGQRHFKDLLHKANGDVTTALRWYNGGSDPQFAQRVQAKVAGHQARLGKAPSTDAIVQELYGPATTPTAPAPAAAPTTDAIVQELYGPTPATTPPVPEASGPGVQPARWRVTIDAGGGTPPDQVEVPGPWQDAVDVVTQLKGQYRPGTQFDIGPVPTEASPWQPEASNPALATRKPPATDLPLEESVNPAELVIGGYGAKAGQLLTRNAGKLVKLGAEGLGLEVGHKVNQAVGNTPGSITDFGWPDVANFVIPSALESVVQTGKGLLRQSRAGQAVQVAKDATAAQEAAYATRLKEAEAAQTRLMPDGSLPPDTLQSLRANPPTPVEPGPIHGPSLAEKLKELTYGGGMGYYTGSKLAGAAVALADPAEALVSKALLSPTLRPWLLRQLEASGGTLTPQTLATLSAVVRGAVPAEAPRPAGP